MTPQELRTDYVIEHNSDYHLDPNLITSGRAVRYIEWLEKKVIDLTESLQFQQDMNALAVGPDVCPKCFKQIADFIKSITKFKGMSV